MRGADDRHVDGYGPAAAERGDLAFLQHAQQARLQRRRHVADLVEQQDAAMRLPQVAACAVPAGARERAFFVAEQLRLDQGIGQRRAIDRHERPVPPVAVGVDAASDQFLAGTRLALDHHRDAGVQQPRRLRDERARLVAEHRDRAAGLAVHGPRARTPSRAGRRRRHAGVQQGAAGRPQTGGVAAVVHVALEQRAVSRRGHGVPVQSEQPQSVAIRGGEASLGVEHQHAFAWRAEQRAVDVAAHHVLVLEAAIEAAMFDLVDGERDQAERVQMGYGRVSGEIEDAHHLALRAENRRCRAGQDAVRLEIVFGAVHQGGCAFEQRGADGVGAGAALRPGDAGPEGDAGRSIAELGAAHRFEHQP